MWCWNARPISAPTRNGVATGLDACGSVAITYSDSVSNGCGGTKIISRLWTATDECGNSTNALQTLTVRDTTPPALICPANVVLECPADTQHQQERGGHRPGCLRRGRPSPTATASATVAAAPRSFSRLWTATDECGNSTNALQTITVRDTTPPALTVPGQRGAGMPGRHQHQQERRRHRPWMPAAR